MYSKLYVDDILYKPPTKQTHPNAYEYTGVGQLHVMSWNVNKNIEDKFSEKGFVDIPTQFDIVFLCECWIRSHIVLNLELSNDEYDCKCIPRSKGKGGGLIILYKKVLSKNIAIEKYIADSVVWLKIENLFASRKYICFSYIFHENNVYYNAYETDISECVSNDIGYFSEKGTC